MSVARTGRNRGPAARPVAGAGWYRWEGNDLLLEVLVQPRASRDAACGEQEGRPKIRLAAPPVDGLANGRLTEWLAGAFEVPKSAVAASPGPPAGEDGCGFVALGRRFSGNSRWKGPEARFSATGTEFASGRLLN